MSEIGQPVREFEIVEEPAVIPQPEPEIEEAPALPVEVPYEPLVPVGV